MKGIGGENLEVQASPCLDIQNLCLNERADLTEDWIEDLLDLLTTKLGRVA